MYDEIGSLTLSKEYVSDLATAGVEVHKFNTTKGRTNRFQLNFRNHRKIVVVDGLEAWVGGHNVADESLGKSAGLDFWRDTHVRLAVRLAARDGKKSIRQIAKGFNVSRNTVRKVLRSDKTRFEYHRGSVHQPERVPTKVTSPTHLRLGCVAWNSRSSRFGAAQWGYLRMS